MKKIPMTTKLNKILKELKFKFKSLVEEILQIRSKFSSNKRKNIQNQKKTQNEDEKEGDITDFVKITAGENVPSFNICIEVKKPYYKIFVALIIISLVAFAIMGTISASYPYGDYIGPWIVVSRGSASAILGSTGILMVFVSYDLLTYLRSKCHGKCQLWLNHNILIHRF